MIYLFFLACLSESTEFEEFEYFGRTIQVSNQKKSLLSTGSSWYFVNMKNFFSINNHFNMNLEITSNNIVTVDWYRLYLTPKQASEISSQFNCTMKPFDDEDKIIDIDFSNNLFYAEFHKSFVPYKSTKTQFTLLFNTIYEISTTEIDDILRIPELLFICNAPENHFHNRWAGGMTQHFGPPRMTSDGFQSPKYLKEHNISGQGQVVTIVDGGLDVTNSYFYDYSNSFEFDQLNNNHRKMIYYDSYGNNHDSKNDGHGTHVAGTVAGRSSCGNSNSLYDGVAPDARIHFIDIGNDDESRKLLSLPITILSSEMGLVDSHVTSNSWGSSSRNYGQTKLYDMASNYLRDRLFVFSAGNDGEKGYITINSPGDAKNILTVGALGETYGQKFDQTNKYNIKLIVEDDKGSQKTFNVNHVSGPKPFETTRGIYRSPTSKTSQENRVFITSNPNSVCSLSPSPIAAIIASSRSPSCSPSNYAVYKSDGSSSDILSSSYVTIDLSISQDFFSPSIASYSSRGPSYFGINKPDVVAPGDEIKSASSRPSDTAPGHGCGGNDFAIKSGTSMACPNIGGLATLVTQYFVDGYYPLGTFNPEKNGFIPGSNLVRALIVASANKLTSTWTPDSNYGHGIPSIDNVLTFDKNLKVFKDIQINQNEDKFFKFTLKKNSKNDKHLRIAMAYLDEPDESENAILVVDIDMYLVTPSGKILYGNSKPNNHEEHLSTVEKIVIENTNIESGEYELHFFGGGRISQTMKKMTLFSLCISGPLEDSSLYNIETYEPSGLAWESKKDTEKCAFPNVGLNCQIKAVEIDNFSSITLYESSEVYMYFYVPTNWSNLTIIASKPRDVPGRVVYQFSGDAIYRTSYNYEKTYSSNEPEYHIFFKRDSFKNPNHTYIGFRVNNLSPKSYDQEYQLIYDDFVPSVPTATTPPATWKNIYIAGVAAGYGLFGLAFISTVFLIVLFCFKLKELRSLQKVSNLTD